MSTPMSCSMRQPVGRVAGLVAQLLQFPLERRVLVRHRHDARPRVAADARYCVSGDSSWF